MNIINFIKKQPIIPILLLAVFLIFFNLSDGGMHGDDAIYSVRSIGNIDFMFADQQPTPLQFFDEFPSWAYLSNHDHPPLLLWIQHIFLIFNDSIFFARLSTAIMGILTVLVLYLFVKKFVNKKTALFSALFLVINPFFIWFSKTAYLEAGESFFIILALFFLLKFLADKKYWIWFGIFLGLALMTKYTALFILPAIFCYLLFKKRKIFRDKRLYFSAFVVLAVISPVIIYNLMMQKTTGHLDLQWAGLFNQESPWNLNRSISHNYFGNFISILKILGNSIGFSYLALFILAFFYLTFSNINSKIFKNYFKTTNINNNLSTLIFFCLFFLTFLFTCIISPEIRFLTLFCPFLAIILGIAVNNAKNANNARFLRIILIIFIIYQAFFTINSVILTKPIGKQNIAYASNKNQDFGINALDKYLDNLLKNKNVANKVDFYQELKTKRKDLKKYELSNSFAYSSGEKFYPIFVYDPNINWFSSVWLIEKRRLYYNLPFFSAQEFINIANENKNIKFYFIKTTDKTALTPLKYQNDFGEKLEKDLLEAEIKPDLIYRNDKEIAFKIYRVE